MNAPISEDDLHAYADGQLDAARLLPVEAWLSAHPEQRALVESWRAQSSALHRRYDAVLDEAVPARLLPAANSSRWLNRGWATAALWLLCGGLGGFLLRGEVSAPLPAVAMSFPRQAAVAHAVFVPEVRHPVEVGADQEAHLVGWLSKRLGAELKPPRLDAAGYRLVGGRLLPGESGAAAQFMYEDESRKRLTLYVRGVPQEDLSPGPRSLRGAPQEGLLRGVPQGGAVDGAQVADFRYAAEQGVDVFYWIEGRFGYALSGTTGRADMLRLATLVYRQRGQ